MLATALPTTVYPNLVDQLQLSITCHITGVKTVQSAMPSDSRARLIAYLCQAGLSTARANALLDDHIAEVIGKKREPVAACIPAPAPGEVYGIEDPGALPVAVGCEHWRREHRADLCPMGGCQRCRYLERL
jgi:hypothetical protein